MKSLSFVEHHSLLETESVKSISQKSKLGVKERVSFIWKLEEREENWRDKYVMKKEEKSLKKKEEID